MFFYFGAELVAGVTYMTSVWKHEIHLFVVAYPARGIHGAVGVASGVWYKY